MSTRARSSAVFASKPCRKHVALNNKETAPPNAALQYANTLKRLSTEHRQTYTQLFPKLVLTYTP